MSVEPVQRAGREWGARGRRRGAIHWGVLAFMLGFSLLVVGLIWFYLMPAGEALQGAGRADRQRLGAVSALLLAVVLLVLLIGLMLTFRIGRYFLPRGTGQQPRKTTQYVDAWAESGKRVKAPPGDRPEP